MRASISFFNLESHIHYVVNTNAHFIKKAKYIHIASTLVKVLVIMVAGVISLYGEVNPYMAKKWGNDFVDGLNKIVFGVSRDEAPDLY